MKTKGLIRALLFAYSTTGIFLFFFAFLLLKLDIGEKAADAGIILGYVISCFAGGFMAGKTIRKNKYLWGLLTGIAYYILLLLVSVSVQGKWDMSFSHAITTLCMCLGGGALGGMFA